MPVLNRAMLARVLPFAIYIGFLALAPWLRSLAVEAGADFDLRWMYAVQTGCVMLALLWFWRDYEELRGLKEVPWTHFAVASLAGVAVFVLWIQLDADWMTLGESAGFDPTSPDGALNWSLIAVRLWGASVIVPIMEELFWRSYVMRWIDAPNFLAVNPARVSLKAFVIAAVVFGLEHHLWFAGIVAGAVYAGLYWYSRNLWVPIVAHAVTNGALGVWIVATREWRFW